MVDMSSLLADGYRWNPAMAAAIVAKSAVARLRDRK